jgi:choline dehydrogenase-like flavoprotein
MGSEAKALLEGMGAYPVRVTRPLSETTVLQGGTCRFGSSPEDSVVDVSGALHAVPNVYLSDGGALPSNGAVPITLTIVANALRTAEHLERRLGG